MQESGGQTVPSPSRVRLDSVFERESVFDMAWRSEREGNPYDWIFIDGRLLQPESVQRWAEDLALLSPGVRVVLTHAHRCRHTDAVWAAAHHPIIHARVAEPLTHQRILELCALDFASTTAIVSHPEVERVVAAVRALECSYQRLYAEVAQQSASSAAPRGPAVTSAANQPTIERELFEAVESLGLHLERCQPLIVQVNHLAGQSKSPSVEPSEPGSRPERDSLWQRLKQALIPAARRASSHSVDVDVGPSGTRFTLRVPQSDPLDRTGHLATPNITATGKRRSVAHPGLVHQLLSKSEGRLSLVARPDSSVPDVSIHIPHPSPCPNRAGE